MAALLRKPALLLLCLSLCVVAGCGAQDAPVQAAFAQATPAPEAIALSGLSFVDVYDANFTLSFDAAGNMVERNDAAGTRLERRVKEQDGMLLVYDDLGSQIAELSYTLTDDGLLCIDYGGTVGPVTYSALPPN